jgi:hypothetical protein
MLKLLIILVIPICLFEGVPLIKAREWKMLIALGTILGIALFIGIGKTCGLPTPLELLDSLLRPVGKVIFKQF